jgi:hypothetical protein
LPRIGIAGVAQARDQRIARLDDRLCAGRDARVENIEQRCEFGARGVVGRRVGIVDPRGRVGEQRTRRDDNRTRVGVDAFRYRLDLGLVVAFGFEERRNDGRRALSLAARFEQRRRRRLFTLDLFEVVLKRCRHALNRNAPGFAIPLLRECGRGQHTQVRCQDQKDPDGSTAMSSAERHTHTRRRCRHSHRLSLRRRQVSRSKHHAAATSWRCGIHHMEGEVSPGRFASPQAAAK